MRSRKDKQFQERNPNNPYSDKPEPFFIQVNEQQGYYLEPRKAKFKKEKSDDRKFFEIVGIVALFFGVIFLLIRGLFAFVGYPVEVTGHSMEPTLSDKERVFANRHGELNRFNIVVFHDKNNEDKRLIKRIIGMPGDTIYYRNDQLYINGTAYTEPYLKEYKKNLAKNELLTADFTLYGVTGYKQIPPGSYFVMGDNRQDSNDSRQFSFVTKAQMEGTANYRLYPFKRMGQIASWAN